ncbi:MAG: threonine synthase [Candidatus Bathyarchaeia archaeon]
MATPSLICRGCGKGLEAEEPRARCPDCGGRLEYRSDDAYLKTVKFSGPLTFWRYRPLLPTVEHIVSLGEGGTTLHDSRRLGEAIGLRRLYLKDESQNPTNSFRDRCASLIVTNAVDLGYDTLVAATTGNLGASLAAYSAKGDLNCNLIVPRAVDMGKLAQMIAYDASIEEYGETVDEAVEHAERLGKETRWYQATFELNPLAVEALKTIAFEVVEQIGVPDWVVAPMGSGGTVYALWKGFKELEVSGRADSRPRLVGVQAEGCSPIVGAFLKSEGRPLVIKEASTKALAICVKRPVYGEAALEALKDSGGVAVSVKDEEMLKTEMELAQLEGIFAEPASAATVASLRKLLDKGVLDPSDTVICLVTSSGLKTTDLLNTLNKRRKSLGLSYKLATKERILRTIERDRTYGYDLWKRMGKRMTLGAVYQHLSELEERGLITSYMEGKRRYFELTTRGRNVLRALDELKSLL